MTFWRLFKTIHNQHLKLKAFSSQKMSTNDSLYLYEMESFSPNLSGWEKYIFSGSALVTIGLAFLVQKAVYKSLKQIGDRPINQMIIPSQVKSLFSISVFRYRKVSFYSLNTDTAIFTDNILVLMLSMWNIYWNIAQFSIASIWLTALSKWVTV